MLCRVEMPTNEQVFGRFYRWRMLHGQRRSGVLLPVVALAAAVLLLAMGADLWLVLLLAGVCAAYVAYAFYITPASRFRQKGGAALQTETTILTETGLSRNVKSEEGGFPETQSVQYVALHSAVETSRDFYLFMSPNEAFLLDKAYFTNGTPEELRAVLKEKMGGKFKPMRGAK